MFGPGGTPLSPIGCLLVGTLLLVFGVFVFIIVAIQPGWLRRRRYFHARWGFGSSSGAPVSRLGGMAWGLAFAAFGAVSVFNGYCGILPKSRVFPILFAAFGLVFVAGIADSYKHKRRGLTRRCS